MPENDAETTAILWLRRDLRLSDHPALCAAAGAGAVVPVFIRDALVDAMGAAAKWRLGLSLAAMDAELRRHGSRLILRSGPPALVLEVLAGQLGATQVHWSRLYDATSKERDIRVKQSLRDAGLNVVSHEGHVLNEPWTVETGSGGFYKVYTPYWNNVKGREVPQPLDVPELRAPDAWPESEDLDSWQLGADMRRGADIVADHVAAGEVAARDRLDHFVGQGVADYSDLRNRPDRDGTSRLSAHFALGEIGIRTAWHATGASETYRKELVWRDFAWHLIHHTPQIEDESWRPEWRGFPWRDDNPDAERWRRGMTGEPIVDAGMRELYVTGLMHNRVRMIVASYLTKHLMTHWRVGLDWFAQCLIDHDPASNAMGWQWAAGCGPDASPYFRVFNPETQAEKFDPDGAYRHRWLNPETSVDAAAYFKAIPKSWGMSPDDPYPNRMIPLRDGRQRALDAYQEFKQGADN
ncbi:deoxyribodipyrimidine photo-lyase [Monaibacterium marinum]|uniref:Deoxyribodipyrimidine photo-lyase n=1 Tax=Pontivivens marinum TaxID=1690039 RepID=A0A2C9CVM5_9RHOB|nr:deoxyribodipyrimidine photo-lyase [Monaibacterium marinum]SOH95322.1 deoxyribodipyrimidine photo-lyase [Monaibacterium marinum]